MTFFLSELLIIPVSSKEVKLISKAHFLQKIYYFTHIIPHRIVNNKIILSKALNLKLAYC